MTSSLIPLCHNILIDSIEIDFIFLNDESSISFNDSSKSGQSITESRSGVKVVATASCEGKTGIEMEALTAASISALTIYDMCKGNSHYSFMTHKL